VVFKNKMIENTSIYTCFAVSLVSFIFGDIPQ